MKTKPRLATPAAGGLLWRPGPKGLELAVIHRRRYNDWSLPKGKVEPGETPLQTARREVEEETGYRVALRDFAGDIKYRTPEGEKVVSFWNMEVAGKKGPSDPEEVEKVVWLSLDEAISKLSYPEHRDLLKRLK